MSFQVQRIDHVEVFVRDLDAAASWYADVLGLQLIHRWDPEPVFIGAGGTALALFQASSSGVQGRASKHGNETGWHRVAWRTTKDDFVEAQAHLARLGIAFRGPIDHDLAWSIYFADPDGNPLEITYYL